MVWRGTRQDPVPGGSITTVLLTYPNKADQILFGTVEEA
jgi:hypothetical protein